MLFRTLLLSFVLLSFNSIAAEDPAVPDIVNMDQIVKASDLEGLKNASFRKLKIAVLDIGFASHEKEIEKKTLPATTQFHPGPPIKADVLPQAFHGTLMAKILAQFIAKSGVRAEYDLHLYKVFGWSKFKKALEEITAERFDIVLYAQTWKDGGNVDGKGFVNALVTKAIKETNVIWINAANEFTNHMKTVPVQTKSENGEEWVIAKDKQGKESQEFIVQCKAKAPKKCDLELMIAWNDVNDDVDVGSEKDLDLFLYDSKGNEVAKAEKIQRLRHEGPNTSIVVSEQITKDQGPFPIDPGAYKVKIKVKSTSKKFEADRDVVRIFALGDDIVLENADKDETILPPAENENVITIGASDDPDSGKSTKTGLPHVSIPSVILLKGAMPRFSTSVATAIATAISTLYVGTGKATNRAEVLEKLKKVAEKLNGKPAKTVSASEVDKKAITSVTKKRIPVVMTPPAPTQRASVARSPLAAPQNTGGPCVPRVRLPHLYPAVQRLLSDGGIPVNYNGRIIILLDPQYSRPRGLIAPKPYYMVMTPYGSEAHTAREMIDGLPLDNYTLHSGPMTVCP